jgi:hypothetical protein
MTMHTSCVMDCSECVNVTWMHRVYIWVVSDCVHMSVCVCGDRVCTSAQSWHQLPYNHHNLMCRALYFCSYDALYFVCHVSNKTYVNVVEYYSMWFLEFHREFCLCWNHAAELWLVRSWKQSRPNYPYHYLSIIIHMKETRNVMKSLEDIFVLWFKSEWYSSNALKLVLRILHWGLI